MLPQVTATRYVTALREGGSLPGIVEADDLGTYVVKFHGAGQGRKALVAEVIVGELARALGLPVPALVTVDLAPGLAVNEPDQEIQELLRASPGLNLGVDFLPGALDLDTGAFTVEPELAGRIVVLDALVANVDRSWRNPNMLAWHQRAFLIDHGAALTFHHNWPTAAASVTRPYDVSEHALLAARPDLAAGADAVLAPHLTDAISTALALVPEEWLADEPGHTGPDSVREAYLAWFTARVRERDSWLTPLAADVSAGPRPAATDVSTRPRWLR